VNTWLSQSRKFLNANAANKFMKFAKFAHSRYSRSKSADLSSDFEKTIGVNILKKKLTRKI